MKMVHTADAQKKILQAQGFKATPQRLAIAQIVRNSMGHLSSEEVFERVKHKLPGISRATVYNTLHTLAECGAIRELVLNPGSVLYDSNPGAHHHFVCEDTGEIIDIPEGTVRPVNLGNLEKDFNIQGYSIVFRGQRKRAGKSVN